MLLSHHSEVLPILVDIYIQELIVQFLEYKLRHASRESGKDYCSLLHYNLHLPKPQGIWNNINQY
jgi:hypothetical protein